MAARVVHQRAVVRVHVLEGDPDSAHEPGGNRVEVHRVRVRVLLRADREVESLEREGLAVVEVLEDVQRHRRQGQHFDSRAGVPRIADAGPDGVEGPPLVVPGVLLGRPDIEIVHLAHDAVQHCLRNLQVLDDEEPVAVELLAFGIAEVRVTTLGRRLLHAEPPCA